MAKTAVATLQTVWECHWSQPDVRLTDVDEEQQPEWGWVCIRTVSAWASTRSVARTAATGSVRIIV